MKIRIASTSMISLSRTSSYQKESYTIAIQGVRIKAAVYIDPGVLWIGLCSAEVEGGVWGEAEVLTEQVPPHTRDNVLLPHNLAPSANLAFKLFTRTVAFYFVIYGSNTFPLF